jgi:hypothetical protein
MVQIKALILKETRKKKDIIGKSLSVCENMLIFAVRNVKLTYYEKKTINNIHGVGGDGFHY